MTRICTIETGDGRAELVERFGDYPSMTVSCLQPHLEGASFSVVRPLAGERLPDPEAFDGYVILGSRHGVYDDLPWIEPLKHLIRQAAERRIPTVGICFGHQIMAEALGGRAEKADAGWIVGPVEYSVSASDRSLRSIALHQDQVVIQPPGTERVLESDTCAIAGLLYTGFPALSVQPHPEFHPAFFRQLLGYLRANPIEPALVDAALARMDDPTDERRLFRALALVLANRGDREAVVASLLA